MTMQPYYAIHYSVGRLEIVHISSTLPDGKSAVAVVDNGSTSTVRLQHVYGRFATKDEAKAAFGCANSIKNIYDQRIRSLMDDRNKFIMRELTNE